MPLLTNAPAPLLTSSHPPLLPNSPIPQLTTSSAMTATFDCCAQRAVRSIAARGQRPDPSSAHASCIAPTRVHLPHVHHLASRTSAISPVSRLPPPDSATHSFILHSHFAVHTQRETTCVLSRSSSYPLLLFSAFVFVPCRLVPWALRFVVPWALGFVVPVFFVFVDFLGVLAVFVCFFVVFWCSSSSLTPLQPSSLQPLLPLTPLLLLDTNIPTPFSTSTPSPPPLLPPPSRTPDRTPTPTPTSTSIPPIAPIAPPLHHVERR
ncbi:hypothetical protein CCMSSC00406_0009640 [Pleurotus cornucopiae]|uniref:Uncharacterized protein n=1 Tax=Pleurotus cornucopiae TaxID=5321 RepID=A0ACB7J959_PLECO|nr:hypothetical protein CCMSSC00406_0009640 [Pleurotus cornucopiae]